MIREASSVGTERAIIVCLPAICEWSNYQLELNKSANGEVMHYKVRNLPKDIDSVKRCYVVHRGYIVGWQEVIGGKKDFEFVCTTTGRRWKGNFILRTGPFHYLKNPIPHESFQGWRYYEAEEA